MKAGYKSVHNVAINLLNVIGQPLFAIIVSLSVGAVLIFVSGKNPLEAYSVMFHGAFGNGFYFSATLVRTAPLIMGGLAVCIAWKSGYEAIGGEGQMIFGALVGALVAYYLPSTGIIKLLAAVLAGAVAGGLYSGISAWLFDKFGVSFLISTLMMNYIANNIASYFTLNVFRDPNAVDMTAAQTGEIVQDARFSKVIMGDGGFSVHQGFFIALILAVIVFIMFKETVFGYEARMGGFNQRFAKYSGINEKKMLYLVIFISGVIAGLGGAFEVLGSKYRYIDTMISSGGYAWTGMVAALLANFNPLGTCLAAILLAALSTGGSALQRSMSIPIETVNMITGTIMLLMSIKLIRILIRHSTANVDRSKDRIVGRNVEKKEGVEK